MVINFMQHVLGSSFELPAHGLGGASEQTLSPENLKCLNWSQLLNEARTFFERKMLD